MTCIIVDDDQKNQTRLKLLIKNLPTDLQIVGSATSVHDALPLIETKNPDLVFLDIRLPVKSGFALLDHFKENLPFNVIFTTKDDQFALQAFKYSAVDYLLKPINQEDLAKAIRKARKANKESDATENKFAILKEAFYANSINKIALTTIDGFTFVKFDHIVRCEAQGNYTYVYLADGNKLFIAKTLKHYENILSEKQFFRIHKSHLINLNYVRKFIKGKKSQIEMTDGMSLEVSFRRRIPLLEKLASMK